MKVEVGQVWEEDATSFKFRVCGVGNIAGVNVTLKRVDGEGSQTVSFVDLYERFTYTQKMVDDD